MKRPCFTLLAVSLFVTVCIVPVGTCQMMNAYLPTNAVAAEPPSPYDLWQAPCMSRTLYQPCVNCGPYGIELPDIPPLQQPFPGPFGLSVPVP